MDSLPYSQLRSSIGLTPDHPDFEESVARCDRFLLEAGLAPTRHTYSRLEKCLLEGASFETFLEDVDRPPEPQDLAHELVFLDFLDEYRSRRHGLYFQDLCAFLGCTIHVFNLRAAYLWWQRRLEFASFKEVITSDPEFLDRVAIVVADDPNWYGFDAVPEIRPPKQGEWFDDGAAQDS